VSIVASRAGYREVTDRPCSPPSVDQRMDNQRQHILLQTQRRILQLPNRHWLRQRLSQGTFSPRLQDHVHFLLKFELSTNRTLPFSKETRDYWVKEIQSNYAGDDGRRRVRMAAINLSDRDGLHRRLFDVKCPVLWLHGTDDAVYSVANAEEEIKLFVNSPDAQLKVVKDGQHFLSFSHPKEVDGALIEFVGKYGK